MKKNYVVSAVIFAVCISFAFAKNPTNQKSEKKEKTIIEQGLSLASVMKEKASTDFFLSMLDYPGHEMMDLICTIQDCDVSEPKAVYVLAGDFKEIIAQMEIPMDFNINDLRPELIVELERTFYCLIPALWNSEQGMNQSAITALLSSKKVFDSDELTFKQCFYIFEFENAYPVMVYFERGEGRAVLATAFFIMDMDFIPSFQKMMSKNKTGMKLQKIQ